MRGGGVDYVVKRLAFALLTIFLVLTFNFVLFRALPGNVVTNLSRVPNATPALRQALAKQFGLDKPKWRQYVIYLDQLAHGNLGVSYVNQLPVATNLRKALLNTIPMVLAGTVLAILLGIVSGMIAAWRRTSAAAHTITTTAIGFYSLPTQWLGLMLIILLGHYFPTAGMHDPFSPATSFLQGIPDALNHMVLPSLTLALTLYGQYTLIVRSAVIETLGEDYVLTARAKGLSTRRILFRHVFPNAILPAVTLMALSLGYIVGGALLVETVFSWPGVGLAVYQAVLERDYPMLQGAFLLLTVSVVFFNLVADLLYSKLDPRVTA